MAEAFNVSELSPEQQAGFFRILHEAGISPHDVELAKLLRALQLYKAWYESIPASVQKAAAEIKQLKTEIEEMVEQADQSAAAGEKLLDKFTQESAGVCESLGKLHSHVEEAATRASAIVANRMKELLSDAMTQAMPLTDLTEAGKVFSEAIDSSRQASAELRANIKIIRWAHLGIYSFAAIVIIVGFLVYIHYRYEARLEHLRASIVLRFEGNHDVLLELAKSNRKLELTTDAKNPKHKLLSIDNATGWTSKDKRGVIEIEE